MARRQPPDRAADEFRAPALRRQRARDTSNAVAGPETAAKTSAFAGLAAYGELSTEGENHAWHAPQTSASVEFVLDSQMGRWSQGGDEMLVSKVLELALWIVLTVIVLASGVVLPGALTG